MKAVMLMFDSLNRHFLSPYGCDWTHTPNFRRLAEKTVTFEKAWCCSMPCMPARRELHTGRPNLLLNNWNALEPFDDSMPELLKLNGVHTHLVSDHYHYWEENAPNYHTKYSTWEFFRGQEGDPWIGEIAEPTPPPHINKKGRPQDWINRKYINQEQDWSIHQTIDAGIAHMQRNLDQDNWFLQIECFDPHEPFYVPQRYREQFAKLREWDGPLFDWPGYCPVEESPEEVEIARHNYAASLAMCDAHLGKVLDFFDQHDLWQDTMLIVNTDHGFLLGEHGWWAKNTPPWWEELSHIPLFIWDPRCPEAAGQRRQSFVQMIDMAPTLLDFFGISPTQDMLGVSLRDVIARDEGGRATGIFGGFGHYVNVTDGRYVYMKAPVNPDGAPLNEYTLLPLRTRAELRRGYQAKMELLEDAFSFTKGMPILRVACPPGRGRHAHEFGDLLYDIEQDPRQENPITDSAQTQRMAELLVEQMKRCEAPAEQYERLGLPVPA